MRISIEYLGITVSPWDMQIAVGSRVKCKVSSEETGSVLSFFSTCLYRHAGHDTLGACFSRMVGRLPVKQHRNHGFLSWAIHSHAQQVQLFFTGEKEGLVVQIVETEVVTSTILLALDCSRYDDILAFHKELSHAGVAPTRGEAVVLDGPRRLHVPMNVKC